jgi:ribosome maturation factor RimP
MDRNMANPVRWNIVVSEEVDLSLRRHLGSRGMRKGDLSKFIEEAVRWKLLDETVQKIKARNKGKSPKKIAAQVDQALTEARSRRVRKVRH